MTNRPKTDCPKDGSHRRQTFCGATPFSPSGGSARASSEASDVQARRACYFPPRLIVPASTDR